MGVSSKAGPARKLVIWRDSVSAGDDCDAPHALQLDLGGNETLQEIIDRLVSANYLASISGGRATWIFEAGSRPLAVIAQQWPQARALVDAAQGYAQFVDARGECHFNFKYWCQADPERVFACLREGKPLPDKYA
ncbi:MAG: hypothetical protein V4857_24965 [Pseudomonadota bacterium]